MRRWGDEHEQVYGAQLQGQGKDAGIVSELLCYGAGFSTWREGDVGWDGRARGDSVAQEQGSEEHHGAGGVVFAWGCEATHGTIGTATACRACGDAGSCGERGWDHEGGGGDEGRFVEVVRTGVEIRADAKALMDEIAALVDAQAHALGSFGGLALEAVLDARPDLKARWDALKAEELRFRSEK